MRAAEPGEAEAVVGRGRVAHRLGKRGAQAEGGGCGQELGEQAGGAQVGGTGREACCAGCGERGAGRGRGCTGSGGSTCRWVIAGREKGHRDGEVGGSSC